ncbi:MAG: ATP-binding protein [Deltaproteobacteria bacterium]|nr:ATP-binding protein [Deltaproteobacteria bacterium]
MADTDGFVSVPITNDTDIVVARQRGRELAQTIGFKGSDLTMIATAISEVARNIVVYAKRGELRLSAATSADSKGIVVVAIDEGPGIADIDKAMTDGFSTGGSLGLGLPGARRLMDELEVISEVGKGTTITMRKWLR